jgi:hypothetical protein
VLTVEVQMELIAADIEVEVETVTDAIAATEIRQISMTPAAGLGEIITEVADVLVPDLDRLTVIDIIDPVVEAVEMTMIGFEIAVPAVNAMESESVLRAPRGLKASKASLQHRSLQRTNATGVPYLYNSLLQG